MSRHLALGEAIELTELEHPAHARGQLGQRIEQLAHRLLPAYGLLRGNFRGLQIGQFGGGTIALLQLQAAQMINGQITHQARQVALGRLDTRQLETALPQLEKSILQHILGPAATAQYARRQICLLYTSRCV